MPDTTFNVSPEVEKTYKREIVDYVGKLRTALRRPIEQHWLPRNPVVACDDDHALLTAICYSFYGHVPLRLTPDALWITLARGFALHVNKNAEKLRHRFVTHSGKEKLTVTRMDFYLGQDNPWPEAFASFTEQIDDRTGGLGKLVRADFSTTGPTEIAAFNLMAMETFKSYFEYEIFIGCGIPRITLAGTEEDWNELRRRVQQFAEYDLEKWVNALDPILEQFCNAKRGIVNDDFWKSMFRYVSGSGPAVMTGWANVLFPYFKDQGEQLYENPYLFDWKQRLEISEQHLGDRWENPQGIGLESIPNCMTSVPLKVHLGTEEIDMRLAGGLLAVTQHEETMTVEPECGWVIVYENPVDELSDSYKWLEEQALQQRQQDGPAEQPS
jgi:hypothetical protein